MLACGFGRLRGPFDDLAAYLGLDRAGDEALLVGLVVEGVELGAGRMRAAFP
jgi:hypothetical protein